MTNKKITDEQKVPIVHLTGKIASQILSYTKEYEEEKEEELDVSVPLAALASGMVMVLDSIVNKEVVSDNEAIEMNIGDFTITIKLRKGE